MPPAGFEPTTLALESPCSDPLSYEGEVRGKASKPKFCTLSPNEPWYRAKRGYEGLTSISKNRKPTNRAQVAVFAVIVDIFYSFSGNFRVYYI